ncbi:MAG: small basic family protein [Armatimonadota bacterium]|nr:small basic family protein [Armatimonadota bacterium]MCX7777569.1 small basic family protein [Armatimonadota bacterium]MDW8025578.1 small basic family protein [Armatimonadota bacterium]
MVSLWVATMALIVGLLLGLYMTVPLTPLLVKFSDYIGLAVLAGFDTIVGGIRAALQGNFDKRIFLSGFFVNMLMASFLAYIGNQVLGIDLMVAVVVVFGLRIFNNLAVIRRIMLDRLLRWFEERKVASSMAVSEGETASGQGAMKVEG